MAGNPAVSELKAGVRKTDFKRYLMTRRNEI